MALSSKPLESNSRRGPSSRDRAGSRKSAGKPLNAKNAKTLAPAGKKPGKKSVVPNANAGGSAARKTLIRAAGKRRRFFAQTVSSTLSYDGPLFRVYTDTIREDGREVTRDVIRHNGSVVILAIDDSASKQDPLVALERQYRHAAGQVLLEIPAGKLEKGENPLAGAKRELREETGFQAKKWTKLTRFFASPGFLGEWMQVFLAEGIVQGAAEPEDDEQIEIEMLPLSELLHMIDLGKIHDAKTLISLMLYSRRLAEKQVRPRSRK